MDKDSSQPLGLTNDYDVTLAHSYYKFQANNILFVKVQKDIFFTISETKEMVSTMKNFGKNQSIHVIIIGSEGSSGDDESRRYFSASTNSPEFISIAIIVTSLAQRMVVNFMLTFNRPLTPMKIFNTPAEAERWTLLQKETN